MRSVAATASLTVAAVVAVLGPVSPAGAQPVLTRATPDSASHASAVAHPGAVASRAETAVRAATPVTLPCDGTFVTAVNRVWRVVGGALVYVSSWKPYGGPHRTVRLTPQQYDVIGIWHVRDGQFIRTIQDGRVYVVSDGTPIYVSRWSAVGGVHAAIPVDVTNLQHAGEEFPWRAFKRWAMLDPDYLDPDHRFGPHVLVSHFVRTLDGRVYVLTAGAPVYVSSWARFGGPQRSVLIDGAAIGHAGQPGPWRFLRWYPFDGVPLNAAARPGAPEVLFVVAGGAPVFIPPHYNLPWVEERYLVDPVALARAGSGGPFDHLRFRPADGTFLSAYHDWKSGTLDYPHELYWVSGGSAIPVRDEAACVRGRDWGVAIDRLAIDNAGTGGVWNHLAPTPVPAPAPPC